MADSRGCALAALLAAAAVVAQAPSASAIVVYDVPGDGRNLAPPPGDQGWASVGNYNIGGGVAVSPHVVLTAQHLNFGPGSYFILDGVTYNALEKVDIPGSEAMLVRVDAAIPAALIADLYTGNDEVGKTATIFGYGGPKGITTPAGGTDLAGKGWYWTSKTTTKSWGANTIDGTGFIGSREILYFAFDPVAGASEGIYSDGDSGGGLFIDDGGVWKVAGINYAVTLFYPDETSPALSAAVYNATGLWESGEVGRVETTSESRQFGAASRISTHADFIQTAIAGFEAVPEPGSLAFLLGGMGALLLRRKR